jgi:HK97 family phage prohead protease
MSDDLAPSAPIEYRAAETLAVRFPDRVIELVAMPYEQETVVIHQGRAITEVCERGAFDGIERRANRVPVNRDHDRTRPVGRALALHPSHEVGLVAELRISQTPLGDETLELAADGAVAGSAAFRPFVDGERWSRDRRSRRLTRCWLGHIGLVSEPAYEGAGVLAVRADTEPAPTSATPILDRILAERIAAAYCFDPR